jgi:hypothetical protein
MTATRLRVFLTAAGVALTAAATLATPPAGAERAEGLTSPPLVSAIHWTDTSAAPGAGQSALDGVSCSTAFRCIAVGSQAE